MTYTTDELLAMGENAAHQFKTTFGYDRADFETVVIHADGTLHFVLTTHDDFQHDLKYKERIDHEAYRHFSFEEITNLSPHTHRTREQRELAVLARQVAAVRHDRDKLASARALAFVASLDPLAKEISGLLEASNAFKSEDA